MIAKAGSFKKIGEIWKGRWTKFYLFLPRIPSSWNNWNRTSLKRDLLAKRVRKAKQKLMEESSSLIWWRWMTLVKYIPARNKVTRNKGSERRDTLIGTRINGARDASFSGDFVREPLRKREKGEGWYGQPFRPRARANYVIMRNRVG